MCKILEKYDRLSIVFVIMVSVIFCLALYFSGIYGPKDLKAVSLYNIPILVFLIVLPIAFKNRARDEERDASFINSKVLFIGFTILMICVNLLWLMVFFPGVGNVDVVYIVASGMKIASQHPWLYCWIVTKIKTLVFSLNGNYENVFLLCALIQIGFAAITTAHCIVWLKSKKVSITVLSTVGVMYLLCPLYSMMFIDLQKDIWFTFILIEWIMLLYDCWESEGSILNSYSFLFRVFGLLVLSLLRNNGIYVSFMILSCMLCIYTEQYKKIGMCFIVLGAVVLSSSCYEKSQNITHLFKETVGIPLQQIGATVKYNGNINVKQENTLKKFMPIDFIKDKYYPYSSDSLKWRKSKINNKYLNTHKEEFLRLWLDLMKNNKRIYTDAYFKATYGFWAIHERNGVSTSLHDVNSFFKKNKIRIKGLLNNNIQKKLEENLLGTVKWFCLGEGSFFWVFIFYVCLLVLKNRFASIIVAVPVLANWITIMLATPIAFQLRYIYIVPAECGFTKQLQGNLIDKNLFYF